MFAEVLAAQKLFFQSRSTLDLRFRLDQLKKLYKALEISEAAIFDALRLDFKKSAFESYGTEIAQVKGEIKYLLKNLPRLMKPVRVKSGVASWPAKSYVYVEPYGVSLIIGPWNYPLMLVLMPLVGAMAAGNCVILKPSELAPHTAAVINKIVSELYDQSYITVVEGGAEETQSLLSLQFDHIFFTGSVKVGKIVYEAAAKNLTPCILELGGKSPCIVDEKADIEISARRIVWGKFVNAGQTCVAPDYLLVHKSIKRQLLACLNKYLVDFYGNDAQKSPDFPRIINEKNYRRLKELVHQGQLAAGGKCDDDTLFIAPTILNNISWDDPVMEDEIFGPILPVLEFDELDKAIVAIRNRPRPLALYYFGSEKKKQQKVISELSYGGGCINDTLLHFGSPNVPVGGVGQSGIGKYHGKDSFAVFSNRKGIVQKGTRIDVSLRYPPYEGKLNFLKWILKL
ncbi:MAG: aldehyde dehydrogenase [Cyclobacteriaceae bacterium]|nr:aldehyde dehydrogenase [Cyclobacteriaceae bacterium]